MQAAARWFLIVVLVLALPLKGLAATGYWACGAEALSGLAAASTLAVESTEHHHDAGHSANGSHAEHESHAEHAGHGEHGGHSDGPGGKCGNCSPCCAAIAPPCAVQFAAAEAPKSELTARVPLLHGDGRVQTLERPPRYLGA